MGLRHDQPPAIGPDPLDIAGDIAVQVLAVLERAALVGEGKRAEEDVADRVAGEDHADIALRPTELAKALQRLLRTDAAGEARIGDIVEVPGVSRAELDN